jgi:hypothetical protein
LKRTLESGRVFRFCLFFMLFDLSIVGLCVPRFPLAILFALHSNHDCIPLASVATAALTEFKTKLSTSSSEEDKFIAQTGVEVYEAMSFAVNKK